MKLEVVKEKWWKNKERFEDTEWDRFYQNTLYMYI